MLTEHSTYFKGLMPKASSKDGEYVYIPKKDRIGISKNLTFKEIVLNKIEAFLPKQIGSLQDNLGLNLLEPGIPTASMTAESNLARDRPVEKEDPRPQQSNTKKATEELKRGSILGALIFLVSAFIAAVLVDHAHHLLPILSTFAGVGIFTLGRSYANEAEEKKKEKLEPNLNSKPDGLLSKYAFHQPVPKSAPIDIKSPPPDQQLLAPPTA
jgi:hypothetical protein